MAFIKGQKRTEEHQKNLTAALKGKKAWNKGIPMPQFIKDKLLASHIGKKHSEESRKKMSIAGKGRKQTEEHIKKRSAKITGSLNPSWKGGITPINIQIRNSVEYKLWRKSVYERDNYTCIWCGIKNEKGLGQTVKLQADHIKPFALYPELRFAIDNGRTLCFNCHKTTPSYGRPKKNG